MIRRPNVLILTAFLIVFPTTLRAANYTFTFDRALPAPAENCFALGIDSGTGDLWTHSQYEKVFYRLDRQTGAILQSFASATPFIADIDVHDGIIFGNSDGAVVRFDAPTGAHLPPLAQPITGGERGLSFIGGDLHESGVFTGFPDDVRIGRIDEATGALEASSDCDQIVESQGLGEIGGLACYALPPVPYAHPPQNFVKLRIVSPTTGAVVEDDSLFAATTQYEYYSPDTYGNELYLSRRDVGKIWVYRFDDVPVATLPRSWGSIRAAYR